MTIYPDTMLMRSSMHLATEVDGELIVLEASRGKYFNLNRGGTEIWHRLEQPCRVDDLCRDLEQIYDAPEGKITSDVMALLADMLAHDLLVVCAP